MKLVTDGMLGKLTRWLRMLGHNVKYASNLDDRTLIKIAKTEKRTLLTRDLELFQQATGQHAEAFLVEGKNGAERLAALSKRFGLNLQLNPDASRCPKCNAKIKPTKKDRIAERIPSSTKTFYEKFWECPRCGKVYWQGAHWKRIIKTLSEAKEISAKQEK